MRNDGHRIPTLRVYIRNSGWGFCRSVIWAWIIALSLFYCFFSFDSPLSVFPLFYAQFNLCTHVEQLLHFSPCNNCTRACVNHNGSVLTPLCVTVLLEHPHFCSLGYLHIFTVIPHLLHLHYQFLLYRWNTQHIQ